MSDPLWVNAGRGDSVGPATISAATDQVTITAHGLNNSQPVMVAALSGGAVGVLREDTIYYVVNSAANTFQLVSAPGDEVIEFAADGGVNVYTAAPSYDAAELRRALSFLLTQGVADRFGARSGVHPGGLDAVSLSGTTWTVRDTKAVVYPGLSSLDGPYLVQLPSESGSLNPAHPSLSRTDAIDIQVQDDDHDSAGFRRARVVYVAGAAGGGEPDLTETSFRMATFTVPAGGAPAPTMTYVAPYTVASGGVLPVRSDAELPTTGLYNGQVAWDEGAKNLLAYTGGAWRPIARPTGWETIVPGVIHSANPYQIPVGVYDMVRITLAGSMDGDAGTVTMRVNEDSTSNLHESAWMTWNPESEAILEGAGFTGTSWTIAKWNGVQGSYAELTMLATHIATNIPFSGHSTQVSSTEGVRRISRFSGRLAADRQLSSVSLLTSGGVGLGTVRVWIEGHRS